MKKKRSSSSKSGNGWLWLFTGVLVGLFAAALLYLKNNNETGHRFANADSNKTEAPKKHAVKFDFYNLLQQPSASETQATTAKSTAPAAAAAKPATNATKPAIAVTKPATTASTAAPIVKIPSPTAVVTPTKRYLLQVASVKNYADADAMKAQLLLLGFNVSIQKITVGNTVWNRVTIGPYNSLTAAQKDQANLRKNQFNSVVMKDKATDKKDKG